LATKTNGAAVKYAGKRAKLVAWRWRCHLAVSDVQLPRYGCSGACTYSNPHIRRPLCNWCNTTHHQQDTNNRSQQRASCAFYPGGLLMLM